MAPPWPPKNRCHPPGPIGPALGGNHERGEIQKLLSALLPNRASPQTVERQARKNVEREG